MVNIQLLNMPTRINAVSTKNHDDSYTIIINSRLNYEQQVESYKHEMHHIVNEDHGKYDVETIEVQAHKSTESKQERIARAWGYKKLVGITKLIDAFKYGVKNRYELAEYLQVTEEYIEDALKFYKEKHGLYYKIDNYVVYFEPLAVMEVWE